MPSLRSLAAASRPPVEEAAPDSDAHSRLISALLGKKE